MKNKEELMDNFNSFLKTHPRNYANAGQWGMFYEELNNLGHRIFAFPILDGSVIHEGDIVMIDNSCHAYPISIYDSLSDAEKISSECVGIAWCSLTRDNGAQIVLVHETSVLRMKNSGIIRYQITKDDICGACYVEDPCTVSKNPGNGFAGQIMGIENGEILVLVRMTWEEVKNDNR